MKDSDLRARVLITRPQPGAARTAAAVEALGYQPVVAPLLRIEPLTLTLPAATDIQAVLVASGHATFLPGLTRDCPVLAVGNATAARARGQGFTTVHSANGDARDLAALATRLLAPTQGPVLLASAQGQGDELAHDLRTRGFTVLHHAVYAAHPVTQWPPQLQQIVTQGQIHTTGLPSDMPLPLHAALFFSAQTAQAFVRLIPLEQAGFLQKTQALALGPAAARVLAPLPWRAIRVAVRPTQNDLLALL